MPYPYAVDNHQLANARFLSDQGAAILIEQADFSAPKLAAMIRRYRAAMDDLLAMARRAHALSSACSARRIADICRRAAA